MPEQQPNAVATQSQPRALTVKEETVDTILTKVQKFQERGELDLPSNYSAGNALKSAWLILQGVVDKNSKPVLQTCTRHSVANSLLDMVLQGLNPAKKQGYFIAYGSTLVFQRSYFGTMAVTKQVVDGVADIYATVVYDGDEFEYEIVRGRKRVLKHTQKLSNVDDKKIVAAYCQIIFEDGSEITDIMTMAQIRKSWAKSKMNPNADGSIHSQFPEEMVRKTIINRACKDLINSSDDKNIKSKSVLAAITRSDEEKDEIAADMEIEANANHEVIDVESSPAQESAPVNGGAQPPPEEQLQGAEAGPNF